MDPRLHIIRERLASIDRILAVSGSKGGIGKSSVASMLALWLAGKGFRTGLFDLDFGGPSDHVVLGVDGAFPREENGIIPPEIHGIRFMSLTYFTGTNPAPLRGSDISNALIELLAITRWTGLDYLVIDMPPGLGDAILDIIRLVKRMEFLSITTGSRLALEVVKKELAILKELAIPVAGVIENMRRGTGRPIEEEIASTGAPFLGSIDFDPDFEDALGRPEALRATTFMAQLGSIAERSLLKGPGPRQG